MTILSENKYLLSETKALNNNSIIFKEKHLDGRKNSLRWRKNIGFRHVATLCAWIEQRYLSRFLQFHLVFFEEKYPTAVTKLIIYST